MTTNGIPKSWRRKITSVFGMSRWGTYPVRRDSSGVAWLDVPAVDGVCEAHSIELGWHINDVVARCEFLRYMQER